MLSTNAFILSRPRSCRKSAQSIFVLLWRSTRVSSSRKNNGVRLVKLLFWNLTSDKPTNCWIPSSFSIPAWPQSIVLSVCGSLICWSIIVCFTHSLNALSIIFLVWYKTIGVMIDYYSTLRHNLHIRITGQPLTLWNRISLIISFLKWSVNVVEY